MNMASISGRSVAASCQHRPWACPQPFTGLRRPTRHLCRAENESSTDVDSRKTMLTASSDEDVATRTEVQKLSELRREQQRGPSDSNIIQGALEEARLITWPSPKKAFTDTILVLAIVTASGSLLFGLNVLLAEASEIWYHR